MAIAIHALDHGKTVTCKLAMMASLAKKARERAGRHLPIKMRSGPGVRRLGGGAFRLDFMET
jgi:hypothetical protein